MHASDDSSRILLSSTFSFLLWLLADDINHSRLEELFVFAKSVLLPCEVCHSAIIIVPCHAIVEEAYALVIVWLVFKIQGPAILHEILEFVWDALT